MIIQYKREESSYFAFTSAEGVALVMAQHPGVLFALRLHVRPENDPGDQDSGPAYEEMLRRVSELLNGEHDCCVVHVGEMVKAVPRMRSREEDHSGGDQQRESSTQEIECCVYHALGGDLELSCGGDIPDRHQERDTADEQYVAETNERESLEGGEPARQYTVLQALVALAYIASDELSVTETDLERILSRQLDLSEPEVEELLDACPAVHEMTPERAVDALAGLTRAHLLISRGFSQPA